MGGSPVTLDFFSSRGPLTETAPPGSWALDVISNVLAQKLTELWQFQNLIYFLTPWPSYLTFDLEKL